jgi:hypothetical protein
MHRAVVSEVRPPGGAKFIAYERLEGHIVAGVQQCVRDDERVHRDESLRPSKLEVARGGQLTLADA